MKTYNVSPYYDDFDESKNFHQIMFRPGYAVQARELTQLQTILRNQIEKFGNHIFKHGSVVIPGNSFTDLAAPFVKITGITNTLQTTVLPSQLEGRVISATTDVPGTPVVRALVKKAIPATDTDPITLYVSYLSGGTLADGTSTTVFQPSQTLAVEGQATWSVTVAPSTGTTQSPILPTGSGSLAFVNAGVYYINGTFVYVESQAAVISKYDSVPSCRVLFKINEQIVDNSDDSTLLDPAQGSYNYAAPGADRVQISLQLVTLSLTEEVTADYVELMRYNNGELEEHARNPRYSELEKSLARRTYDESGNYVVAGLEPVVREHLKDGNNDGVYVDGDTNKLVVEVSSGKAYIEGFEVDKVGRTRIAIDKARTTDHVKVTEVNLRPRYGQYILVSDIGGQLEVDKHQEITLLTWQGGTVLNAKVGTAKAIALNQYRGDTDTNTTNVIYQLWITDLQLEPGNTIENAGAITFSSGKTARVIAELYVPNPVGTFAIDSQIVWPADTAAVGGLIPNNVDVRAAKVKLWAPTTSTLYVYKHQSLNPLPRSGDQIKVFGGTTTGTVQGRTVITTAGPTGLIFPLPKSNPRSLTNAAGAPDVEYVTQRVYSFSGDTATTVISALPGKFVELADDNFMAFAFGTSTATPIPPSAFQLTDDSTFTFTGGGTYAGKTIVVYADVRKRAVSARTKTIDTRSESRTAASTITLQKADIISLTSVRTADGSDITSRYELWNGQTDYQYRLGEIRLKPSTAAAPTGTLTIEYRYYQHGDGDFCCVDSYSNVPGYLDNLNIYTSNTTNTTFDLLSCIDFRPVVGSNNSLADVDSIRGNLVISDTAFSSSLQYFVPRIDTLVVDAAGKVNVLRGTPSESPIAPTAQLGQFPLNLFYVDAYTRTSESVTTKRLDVQRYSMEDIHKIVDRVERLEDFATLTAAESSVINYEIIDAETGLSRFKTGYLVESFEEPLTIARATSGQYRATVIDESLQAGHETVLCELQLQNENTHTIKNGYLMLPYTEAVFARQPLSSRVTNLNPFAVVSWNGVLRVDPPFDRWVEVVELPTIFETRTVFVDVPFRPAPPVPAPVIVPVPPPLLAFNWVAAGRTTPTPVTEVTATTSTPAINWWTNMSMTDPLDVLNTVVTTSRGTSGGIALLRDVRRTFANQ